jgi:hypothetical protein
MDQSTPDRALRLAADLLRLGLVIAAVSYLSFSIWHKHMGYAIGLMAIGAIALRFAKAPAIFDFLFVALLSIDVWATASGLMDELSQNNDRPGHILISAAVTPILFYGAARLKAVNATPENAAQTLAVGLVAMTMTMALGVLWELIEWQSDMRFGTDMSLGYSDTLGDLVCDVIGGFAGAAVLVVVLARQRAKARSARPTSGPENDLDELQPPALALKAFPE